MGKRGGKRRGFNWGDVSEKFLKELCETGGLSDGKIADEINRRFGSILLTRNAIIGKRHRMNISKPNVTLRKNTTPRPRRPHPALRGSLLELVRRVRVPLVLREPVVRPTLENVMKFQLDVPELPVRRLSLEDNDGCRWPLDDGNYCGNPFSDRHPSYCSHHAARSCKC